FSRGKWAFDSGAEFLHGCGMRLLPDPYLLDLYGLPTLLSHGDMLCTDDVAHQAFRARYLDPEWRASKLRLPLWLRRLVAIWARHKSRRGKAYKPHHIMDVNTDTVIAEMHKYGAQRLIHGHTHRPDTHEYTTDGTTLQRIVLPDWRPGRTGILV